MCVDAIGPARLQTPDPSLRDLVQLLRLLLCELYRSASIAESFSHLAHAFQNRALANGAFQANFGNDISTRGANFSVCSSNDSGVLPGVRGCRVHAVHMHICIYIYICDTVALSCFQVRGAVDESLNL